MTLCIAAASLESRQPLIVLAADSRIETDFAGAEIGFKLGWVAEEWPALFAGNIASARELLQTYMAALKSVELNGDNLYAALKEPAELQKLALCDHHVRMKLGMSYKDFLEHGRGSLSDATFQETEFEIRSLDLGCDLITCGFPNSMYEGRRRVPHIFTINADGRVCREDNFAAIGTGSIIAQSVMYQRKLDSFGPLARTIYVVYEAMRLARIAPGVDHRMTIIVVRPHADGIPSLPSLIVGPNGYKLLDEQFQNYGPKSLNVFAKMDEECFVKEHADVEKSP
jgi:hypothetical protein